MNLQSMFLVSLILAVLGAWILLKFMQRKLNAGQTLFWLGALLMAALLTLSPALVDRVSVVWGNLYPVSWLSFLGLSSLAAYLIHQSMLLNELQSRLATVTRTLALLEERVRTQKKEPGDG